MRTFKVVSWVFMSGILVGQAIQVKTNDGEEFQAGNTIEVEKRLDSLLFDANNLGDVYYLKDFQFSKNIEVTYEREENPVIMDSIEFVDYEQVSKAVKKRLFSSLLKSSPMSGTITKFKGLLGAYPFMTDQTTLTFGRYLNSRVGVVIHFKPKFESYFSGIMGASRKDGGKWMVTGEINVHLENQWKSAGTADIVWKRTDESSQFLNMKIEEPYPFGFPFGGRFEFSQDLRDGLYVATVLGGAVVSVVPGIGKWLFGGRSSGIMPTAMGDSLGLEQLVSRTVFIENAINKQNDRWMPTKGMYWTFNGEIGSQKRNEVSETLAQAMVAMGWIQRLSPRIFIRTQIWGKGIWVESNQIHPGQKIRYGGANSLRGYHEDLLVGDWVVIPKLEGLLSMGPQARLFMFSDLAIQSEYELTPFAWGFGFRQVSNESVIEVVYGIGREDSLSKGKLHVTFINKF